MREDTRLILNAIGELRRDITEIKIILKNVTNKNLKLIAKGHLNLTRKLDEALKNDNEKNYC